MAAPTVESFTVRLAHARLATPRVRQLFFERTDGLPFDFLPGQWVSLRFPFLDEKGRPVRRSYSIASVPGPATGFELLVTKVDGGAGSTWLHELPEGGTVEVRGPQGLFLRPLADAKPSLFIATGTGIAPIRGMVAAALAAGRTEPLWLLFGVRTLADALYLDELRALEAAHPFVRLELTLSRPPPEWTGRQGYVQRHVRELWDQLAAVAGPPEAYVCGVLKMLTDVREVLKKDLGLDRQRIHAESYG